MGILSLKYRLRFWTRQSSDKAERRPLLLAGISKKSFINQWGCPEIQIALACTGVPEIHGSPLLRMDRTGGQPCSVFFYKARNRLCFFRKNKLVFHFTLTYFEEKGKRERYV